MSSRISVFQFKRSYLIAQAILELFRKEPEIWRWLSFVFGVSYFQLKAWVQDNFCDQHSWVRSFFWTLRNGFIEKCLLAEQLTDTEALNDNLNQEKSLFFVSRMHELVNI